MVLIFNLSEIKVFLKLRKVNNEDFKSIPLKKKEKISLLFNNTAGHL